MSVKVKKGDLVFVNCGKDKGKTGKVTKVLTKKNKLFVEGINMVKNTLNHLVITKVVLKK